MICPVRVFRRKQHIFFTENWLQRFNMKPHHYLPPYLTEFTCGNNWRKYHVSICASFSGIIYVNLPTNFAKIIFQDNDEKPKHHVNHVKYHGKLSFKCTTI